MYKLHHYYLCPSSRFVRLVLEENKIEYETQLENYWAPQKGFLHLNPAGHLPVLINNENYPLIGSNVCMEYFNNLDLKLNLLNFDYKEQAEIRRLFHWFEYLFKKEVLEPIIYEKVYTRIVENIIPNSHNIRAGLQNLSFHIDYIDYLLKERNWIAGENLSFSDLVAAANLSVMDYLGLLDFGKYQNIKEWYLKIKSRPSFKTLLKDQIVGLNPDNNYNNLDF
jgi:glutathione S-transferase